MKFAIVAALMAAVSATGNNCATVDFHLFKKADCSEAAPSGTTDAF